MNRAAALRPAQPTCPTCGCAVHAQPRTWEAVCTTCGEKRWPLAVLKPALYVCARCRVTSPAKRAAARAAGQSGRSPAEGGLPVDLGFLAAQQATGAISAMASLIGAA